ncbi:MAG: WXG100 family type VII secretion target [Anaerolineaceae bacterium]|nr:WXG100 family type VII secretion target [Anaerolineaceae bacterium]
MAGDKIEINYEELQRSSQIFASEAEDIQALHNKIRTQVENLHGNGWIGKGSDAFYREMDEYLVPGFQKLAATFEHGSGLLGKIADLFQQAEEEAGALFKRE